MIIIYINVIEKMFNEIKLINKDLIMKKKIVNKINIMMKNYKDIKMQIKEFK